MKIYKYTYTTQLVPRTSLLKESDDIANEHFDV